MNIERIRLVRDLIRKLPVSACDMGTWLNRVYVESEDSHASNRYIINHGFRCGTVGCIAGWTAVAAYHETPDELLDSVDPEHFAALWLELTPNEAICLFTHFPHREKWQWKAFMETRLNRILRDGRIDCPTHECDDEDEDVDDSCEDYEELN
jgi:hypothetical protein